jgi:hypothetical protein
VNLHYKIHEGDTSQYCDVMSLYPYICKYFKFPVGYHVVYAGDACKDIDAMLKRRALSNARYYHPNRSTAPSCCFDVVRNYFCVCCTCAFELNTTNECIIIGNREGPHRHLNNGRDVNGGEKRLSLSSVVRVYQYTTTQYDPQLGWPLCEYINTFLKLKSEATGYPAWV